MSVVSSGIDPRKSSRNTPVSGQGEATSVAGRSALETALWALDAGLWPVLIHPPGIEIPDPDGGYKTSDGKQPIAFAWGMTKTKPTEGTLVVAFRKIPPPGIGLKLGPKGGVIDLDIDQPEYAGPVLERLFPGGIPDTFGWHNAEGRFHLLFRWDDRLAKIRKSIIKGVVGADGEIEGNPHYPGLELRINPEDKQVQSVIPPSPLADGTPRAWNGHAEILPLPESVLADLERHAGAKVAKKGQRKPKTKPEAKPFTFTATNAPNPRLDAYVNSAFRGECDKVACSIDGYRNATLNAAAYSLGQLIGAGALDRSEVESALTAAAEAVNLDASGTAKTINSGITSGISEPRDLSHLEDDGAGSFVGSVGTSGQVSAGIEGPGKGGFVGSVGTPPEVCPEFEGGYRPIQVDLLAVPPIEPTMIPFPFRDWISDIATRGCFPMEYPAAAALVALGALIGRRLAMRPKRHDDWLVVPNLWGGVVGPPGGQKTPAVDEAVRPLKRLAIEADERHKQEVKDHKQAALVLGAKSNAAKKLLDEAAKKGKSDAELSKLAAIISAAEEKSEEPKPKRYIVNDTTVEKLGELLKDNPNGLLLFRDELVGLFKSMDRQGHESDRGFYLESWNGLGSYTYDRIGRGTVKIPNVCMSLFGTIQPGPLSRYLRGAAGGEEADGFMPRFQILVYPDPPRSFVNVDRYPDTEAKNRAYEVFKAIDSLDPAARGCHFDEDRKIAYVGFDPDAQGLFDQWRTMLENRLLGADDNNLIKCHMAKFRSLMPSLALIFHVVRSAHKAQIGPVPLKTTEAAIRWCDFLESHARRVYQSAMDGDPEVALQLSERIKQSLPNPFTFRQVAQKGWAGLSTVEDVRKAIGILEDRGWVKVVEIPSGPSGGRPSEKVWINPAVRQ